MSDGLTYHVETGTCRDCGGATVTAVENATGRRGAEVHIGTRAPFTCDAPPAGPTLLTCAACLYPSVSTAAGICPRCGLVV